jgi:hypothetical protein
MKIVFVLLFAVIFCFSCKNENASHFDNAEEAKNFFEKLDDEWNKAMVESDSTWFENHLHDNYINCTPHGSINNKKDEIHTLLKLPLSDVRRVSPEFEIFTYSGSLASVSVLKKLTNDNSVVSYVRRTTVFQYIDGTWKSVSGQGTLIPTERIE